MSRALPLLLTLLLATPALAQDEPLAPEAAALAANAAVQEHCSYLESNAGVGGAATSLEEAARVWRQIDASYTKYRVPYLLYWRGVLGECVRQDERAILDLKQFLRERDDDGASAGFASDAERRLRRLLRSTAPATPSRLAPGLVLTGVGAGVAAAGGIWHADAFRQAELTRTDAGWSSTSTADDAQWNGLYVGSRVGFGLLIGGAVATATGVVIAATAETGPKRAFSGRPGARPPVAVVPVLTPTPGGVALGLGGRF